MHTQEIAISSPFAHAGETLLVIFDSSNLNLINKVSFVAMTKKAKGQEEIRERVALLLRTQSPFQLGKFA